MPSMDHRVAVEVVDEFENALLELVLGGDADVTEYGAGGIGKEALDEVEPRSVLGGEDELEAPFGSGREPSLGFSSRKMRGVIVENDLDRGCRGVSHVEETKEFDELATAMAISDQGMDLPGEQVDARHQGDCSVPLVLVIASDCRMSSGNRRQIGSRRADRLDAWFLVIEDHRGDTYRAVYTVKFESAVYVLHAFQKKARKGIKTPQEEIDLVRRRFKVAEQDHNAQRRGTI